MAERISGQHKSIDVEGIGLLEIDRTVYNWFNNKHPTLINARKVPVVFGSWERWAQMQGNKEDENLNSQRDHKGMIKLPIISISRGNVEYDKDKLRIYTIDIEVESEYGFPNVSDCAEKMICITVKDQVKKQILVWGMADYTVKQKNVHYIK